MRVLVMDRALVGGVPVFAGRPTAGVTVTPGATWSTVTPVAISGITTVTGDDQVWVFYTTASERLELGVWDRSADAPADASSTDPSPARGHVLMANTVTHLRIVSGATVKVRTTSTL